MTINRRYYGFLDLAIIVAVIRVVINHALTNYFILTTGAAVSFHAMPAWGKLLHSLVRFSVPVFVLTAGFKYELSTRQHKNLAYFPYFTKRIKRLLRPYSIWTLIYYISVPHVSIVLASGHPAFQNYPFPSIKTIWSILNGAGHPAYQLWFIPMFLLIAILYPFIKKYAPLAISQPSLWALYFLIRYHALFHNLGQPYTYFMYFVFYDLGALLSKGINRYGSSKIVRYAASPILILTATFFSMLELKSPSPVHNYIAITGSEIFVSLALFFLCYTILPEYASESLKYFSGFVWPVFILHEPIVMGSLAWIVYKNFNTIHPVDLLLVIISTLLFSGTLYAVLKKTRFAPILF